MYKAIVTRITTTPVAGLDNLVAGHCHGYQVLVGKDTPDGALGLFFEAGGQLSEEFATANDLVRRKDENGNPAGGMFEENRRVKSIKLRGRKSEGFWTPLTSLPSENGAFSIETLQEGDQFDSFNGVPICQKYITAGTRTQSGRASAKAQRECAMFRRHVDTEPLRKNLHLIPDGSVVTITEKLHGTSFRYGYVLDDVPIKRNWFMSMVAKLLRWPTTKQEWCNLNGTRRTILERYDGPDFYGNDQFRVNATKGLEGKLLPGEVIYGELVGWTESGTPIMAQQDTRGLKDKSISKAFGDTITYTYGCEPGQCKLYVYRITRTNEAGQVTEYDDELMRSRCDSLGLNAVPFLDVVSITSQADRDHLVEYADQLVDGDGTDALPSWTDSSHPRKGVVLRIDHPTFPTVWLKHKNFIFGVLEGWLKEDGQYVDTEEAA